MKKFLFISSALFLTACSSQPEGMQSNIPLDLKSVADYQAQVSSGNTIPVSQRKQTSAVVEHPLNASDSKPKTIYRRVQTPVIISPSIGYGYYRGF
ncbi:MAG: hypothetical protein Q4B95_04230 [Lonepinella koalarum]|nr:hypothetical protein [Lonepinella koalarum]